MSGANVREARREKGLTQFELSKRVGCTESYVCRIETGRTSPDRRLKESLARELDLALCEV